MVYDTADPKPTADAHLERGWSFWEEWHRIDAIKRGSRYPFMIHARGAIDHPDRRSQNSFRGCRG